VAVAPLALGPVGVWQQHPLIHCEIRSYVTSLENRATVQSGPLREVDRGLSIVPAFGLPFWEGSWRSTDRFPVMESREVIALDKMHVNGYLFLRKRR